MAFLARKSAEKPSKHSSKMLKKAQEQAKLASKCAREGHLDQAVSHADLSAAYMKAYRQEMT